jgi:hypothetical protein
MVRSDHVHPKDLRQYTSYPSRPSVLLFSPGCHRALATLLDASRVGDSSSILGSNGLFGSMTLNLTCLFFWPWNSVSSMAILFMSNLKIRFCPTSTFASLLFCSCTSLCDRIWFCFDYYSSFHLHSCY